MARLMSVTLTEQAVIDRSKTVTRRLGWSMLRPGDELRLVRKAMGRSHRRPDGTRWVEPLVDVALVAVVSIVAQRLDAVTDDDVRREGFLPGDLDQWPGATESERFVAFFCSHMRCTPETVLNRIEWAYLPPPEGGR